MVTTVLKDMATAVWTFKGGGGRRHTKGQAGPDLTRTVESVEKYLRNCDSTTAFFGADTKLRWEHAFHAGGAIKSGDKKKKIDTLVLLGSAPVAGRAVKLGK